ncbi:MAG: PEP-CTERM sorting domain-containing protein [Planctomycetota bacterium]
MKRLCPTPFPLFAALVVSAGLAGSASAQLSDYSQDFEGLNRADPNALINDGWQFFAGSRFGIPGDPDFDNFGAGPFGAPNNIVAPNITVISDVPSGGDPPAGSQGLVVFSDYANALHTEPMGAGTDPRDLIISVFQEQTISASDIGESVTFSFLADGNEFPPTGNAQTEAFLITLDPNNGFASTNDLTVDTTTLADGGLLSGSITLSLADPLLQGQILQFGFRNFAQDFEGSAVDYDNVSFTVTPEPASAALVALGAVAGVARRRRR